MLWVSIMKITESVESIDGTMANTYVIRHDGKIVLIDTGMKSSAKKIIDFFDKHEEKPDAILITHYHPDHIGGLARLVEKYDPEVYVHSKEVEVLRGNQKITPAKSFLSKMVSTVTSVEPVEKVESLEKMPFTWIKVVETQGHTPGSTSFLYEPDSLLFVGDAVNVKGKDALINKKFSLDLGESEKSREKILSMKGKTILPGHGEPLKIE